MNTISSEDLPERWDNFHPNAHTVSIHVGYFHRHSTAANKIYYSEDNRRAFGINKTIYGKRNNIAICISHRYWLHRIDLVFLACRNTGWWHVYQVALLPLRSDKSMFPILLQT